MTEEMNKAIRELPAEGFIRFSIKAEDTEANQIIHDDFKEYSKLESDNNYTLALKTLLSAVKTDFKYEILFDKLMELRQEVEDLKAKPVKTEVVEEGEF